MISYTRAQPTHTHPKQTLEGSATRIGKISPLWQTITSLWQKFDGLFLIWQNAEPTLANLRRY